MDQSLLAALNRFADELKCPICHQLYTHPYSLTECGHVFCHDCIYMSVRERCICPVCALPIMVKNLRKNTSYSAMVGCVRKLCARIPTELAKSARAALLAPENSGGRAKAAVAKGIGTERSSTGRRARQDTKPQSDLTEPCHQQCGTRTSSRSKPTKSTEPFSHHGPDPKATRPINAPTKHVFTDNPTTVPLKRRLATCPAIGDSPISKRHDPCEKTASGQSNCSLGKIDKRQTDKQQQTSTGKPTRSQTTIDKGHRSGRHPDKQGHFVLLMTGLDREQKQIIASSCQSIGRLGEVGNRISASLAKSYSSLVTHIITNTEAFKEKAHKTEYHLCPRTVKYLLGILEQKFIVRYEWFLQSLSAGYWVDEQPYLVDGDLITGKPTKAVARSIQDKGNPIRLFEGMQIYLAGSFGPPSSPSKTDLTELVRSGGGMLVSRRPSRLLAKHNKDESLQTLLKHQQSTLVIFDPDRISELLGWLPDYPKRVGWPWLLDCISCYHIKGLDD